MLTYTPRSWIAQVEGKKYYLLNLSEEEQAAQAIARMLAYGVTEEKTEAGAEGETSAEQITLYTHAIWLSTATLGTVLLGMFLKHSTDAAMPYLDAFTTIFSLVATWLMINLVHDNWLYWIVIDTVSIYLYAKRGLKLGSVLFALYLLLALDGYFEAIQIF